MEIFRQFLHKKIASVQFFGLYRHPPTETPGFLGIVNGYRDGGAGAEYLCG